MRWPIGPTTRKPFVGTSAFAHKGGVHADAAAKVKHSYEHIEPELVGNRTRVLVSDMSGRSSVMMKAKEIGVELDARSPELKDFLGELKELEFKGYEYEAADASFKLLLNRFLKGKKDEFELIGYRVMIGRQTALDRIVSEATVQLKIGDEIHHTVAEATGPVNALDKALRKAIAPVFPMISEVELIDFKVRILESQHGADAIIRVQIESTDGKNIWGTVGARIISSKRLGRLWSTQSNTRSCWNREAEGAHLQVVVVTFAVGSFQFGPMLGSLLRESGEPRWLVPRALRAMHLDGA